jgi:hypothetical protein
MDPKGKGMVVKHKEKESLFNEPRDDKPTDSGSSHKKRDGKKKRCIKKIIYYDSDASSSSPRDDDDNDDSSKRKTVNQNYSFDYSRIPYNSNAHLLSIPLRKPPHFDGEDYSVWSRKMRSHLFSLHPSIWEIMENGMHFDSTDNHVLINEQIHKNAQATIVLLASLCRDEYNKVSGLDNAKQIWDTLKISHVGNDATMITNMELVEGELGRFGDDQGRGVNTDLQRAQDSSQQNLKYGSTRWTDHDVVQLMLRSFTVIDPHLLNLIRVSLTRIKGYIPRLTKKYTKMTLEEILGKFVSGRMMVKEARYVDDALNGPLPVYEPQPIALKATSSREALPSKVAQVDAARLNEDAMALIIKSFKTALKGHKEYPNKNKTRGKRSCFKCGKTGHFIAQCPDNDNGQGQEKHGKREKKKNYRKAKGEAHIGKEWDSDCSSSDSEDEGLATLAFNKSSLFPNEYHTCLMDKEKVRIRDTPKYSSSSDEESSDDEVDYTDLFKGLDRAKVDKINELIDALNEKDRLLEKQEDILYEEHDKFVSVQKSLALEIKKNEILSSELSSYHESITSLKDLNNDLNTKLEKENATSSCVEHVVVCNRCKEFDVDACNEHASIITKLNNEVASLNAQLKTCMDNYEKLKFARDAYTVGRHPPIKDGLGFRKETKNLTSQRTPGLNKEKGKAPMASSSSHDQKNHAYLYVHVKKVSHHDKYYNHVAYHNSHAMVASSSTHAFGRNRPRLNQVVSHAPRKACNGPTTIYHACNASFVLSCKNATVVATKLGSKCKGDKTCIWVPKTVVTNLVGPNKSWVPKTQA